MDFGFASHQEICAELGARLKAQRLAQLLKQADLAARAGVSAGTIKNLEATGQTSLESLVRVVSALGLTDHLDALFKLQPKSISQMEQAEHARRQRAPRSTRG